MATISARRLSGHLLHQLASRHGQGDAHPSPVRAGPAPVDEVLAHQAVAHAGGRRRLDAEGDGQVGQALGPASGYHDERPVLGEGDVFG